jgi:hypothetical protein
MVGQQAYPVMEEQNWYVMDAVMLCWRQHFSNYLYSPLDAVLLYNKLPVVL